MTPQPEQRPLLSHLEAEDYLADRLKAHGCDLYAAGPCAHYRDRIRATILANGMQTVLLGRNQAGKLETYRDCFQRIYGVPLDAKKTVAR
jgi:hypothetical protein